MIHQHPLAYLLGLEGVALLRAFAGEHDEAFVAARLAEVRSLLERADGLGPGGSSVELTSAEAYASWAAAYDQPGNQVLEIEGPLVRSLLDGLPVGDALDAACGTGRHAEVPGPARAHRDRRGQLAGDAGGRAGEGAVSRFRIG